MNGKTDASARKIELINKKVSEINERRRGMKITALEDELDRQELRNYIRILGVEPGTVRLESVGGELAARDRIFYATIFVEALIMLAVVGFTIATLLKPELTNMDWATCAVLLAVFGVVGYRIFKDIRPQR